MTQKTSSQTAPDQGLTDQGFTEQGFTPELTSTLTFTLNDNPIHLKDISPTLTLLRYLQQNGYTGTKEGCGDGDCGACTVAVIGKNAQGKPQYQAINSCLIPLAAIANKTVITVEGITTDNQLTNSQLHPVQTAMVATGGSQCGYCTPGFIMSLFAAYYEGQVDDLTVEGNLCRCTGYLPIRQAAKQVTNAQASDRFSQALEALSNPESNLESNLKLSTFAYQGNQQQFYRPTALAEALTQLQQHPEAVLLAGGTDLGLEMSRDRYSFPILISLEAVPELQTIVQTNNRIEIGAAVPLTHLQTQLKDIFPSLDEMLHWFAARQVRNRATLGGNLGTASPIGDLPPALLSLDATLTIAKMTEDRTISERTIPIANFFQDYRQTDLQSGEVIRSINIPTTLTPGAVHRFNQSYKVGKRGTDDISIVAAAFTIDVDANNQIIHARLAYGGVAATPIRAIAIESMLLHKPWTIATVQDIKPHLKETFTPLSDLRGSAAYRRSLVANLFEKFFYGGC
jgi:xanthine dehydrogenase small subunit